MAWPLFISLVFKTKSIAFQKWVTFLPSGGAGYEELSTFSDLWEELLYQHVTVMLT
jgi:hypothetical protein